MNKFKKTFLQQDLKLALDLIIAEAKETIKETQHKDRYGNKITVNRINGRFASKGDKNNEKSSEIKIDRQKALSMVASLPVPPSLQEFATNLMNTINSIDVKQGAKNLLGTLAFFGKKPHA